MPMRRKYALRKRRAGRRAYKKRVVRRRAAPKQGGMFVVRKVTPIRFYGSGTLGTITYPTANNSLILGTPVATGLTNMYDVPFAIQGRLDDVDSYTELTNLFDRYKIVSVKAKFQSCFTTGSTTTIPLPFIDYITDHDDSVPPSVTGMRQKMGVRSKYFGSNRSCITMGVRPVPANLVYGNSVVSPAYSVPRPMFINCTYPGVEHYGIKGFIRNVNLAASAGVSPFTVDISYGIALRDVQ